MALQAATNEVGAKRHGSIMAAWPVSGERCLKQGVRKWRPAADLVLCPMFHAHLKPAGELRVDVV